MDHEKNSSLIIFQPFIKLTIVFSFISKDPMDH